MSADRDGGELLKIKIGIPTPTSGDTAYNDRCWPEYAQAVREAGGEAVLLPVTDAALCSRFMATCDGFVLPGSPADVEPELYGHTREEASALPDAAREACDREILGYAERHGTPILGICFGMQILNVLRGGTLVQDLRPVPVNHGAGAQVGVAHMVQVVSMSLLGSLLTAGEAPSHGQFRRLPVNSSHHQAVAIPGDRFTAVARASEDGVVEAVEGKVAAATLLGVQWHPERTYVTSAASRALFQWIVLASEDNRDARTPDV